MSQTILWVTRHKLLSEQKAMLKKKHGAKAVIQTLDTRFTDTENLVIFHEIMDELYDFIYYVLPKKLKQALIKLGKKFGVIERPEKTPSRMTVELIHYSSSELEENSTPACVASKTFCKKGHSKNYINRKFFM